ncbi:MAG: hypothetical protein Q7U86_02265 [Draconibacterium sp.]|nr:hypothetical protein [Draconibacterium sp.]
MKKFISGIAIISVFLTLIGWLIFSQFIPEYYLPVLPFLLVFFIAISISVHAFQLQQAKNNMAKFARNNMLVTFLKLILYSAVAVIYFAFDSKNAKVFFICFMLFYLIFTVYEVASLVRVTSGNKKKG